MLDALPAGAVLLVTAGLLVRSRIGTVRQSLGTLAKLALAAGVPMVLILLQPDLKSAIVLPPMVFAMLYVSKLSTRFFAGALAAFLLLVGIVSWDLARYVNYMETNGLRISKENQGKYEPHSWLPYVHDYQRNRVLTFLNPEKYDKTGIGWNQEQSLISVGSGGLFGKGFGEGTQSHLSFLPERQTDFIFTMLAEELGMVGALGLLALYVIVLIYGYSIAFRCRHQFGRLVAMGLTTGFFLYFFINIAMVMGLLPVVGVTLPFISYGGTSLLTLMLCVGLLMNIHVHRDVHMGVRGGFNDF